jgi:hypothetical protein
MPKALSRREMHVAVAVAEVLAPPTAAFPDRPDDIGFRDRLTDFVGRLSGIDRLGVRLFFRILDWMPLLLLSGITRFGSLDEDRRGRFMARLADSRFEALRTLAKVALLTTMPAFYADAGLRERLGDKTQDRTATKSLTFPVERGEEVAPDGWFADVVIVGSGAGGAPLAAELAQRGHSVIVLEEGGYRPASTYPPLAFDALSQLYRNAGAVMTLGFPPIVVPVGRVVGGTTVVNSGTCFRIPDFVHTKWREEYGMPEDLGHEAMSSIYAHVEELISVRPVPPGILGANNEVAKRGSEALGWSGGYLSRNHKGCVGSNRCAFGCPVDAKQAMHITYLPAAVAAGARVICATRVERVLFDDAKRAIGVRARVKDADGKRRRIDVRASVVVVCAGTFYTPGILRASGVRHRNLGRRLTLHPALKVSGLFPGEDFMSGPGVPQSWYVDEFQRRGIMMEGAHIPPDMACTAMPGTGAAHKALMERSREIAHYGFLVSDEPSGSVHRGLGGRPFLRYDLSERDHGRVIFGLKRLVELYVAAGAQEIYLPTHRLPIVRSGEDYEALIDGAGIRARDLEMAAFHPLGTCSFGVDDATFPLDCDLKVRGFSGLYVADGSIFPSSLAVNPQESIMAMATRCAWHLDERVLPAMVA